VPDRTVGSAKNGIRPTNSKASGVIPSAPAMRTNSLAIGLLRSADTTTPAIDQAYEKPPSCPQHHYLNTQPGAEFHHRGMMLGPGAVATLRSLALEEQRRRAALVMGGRPSFPPPPVLGRSTLGAVDMPIGCALIFFDVSASAIPVAAQSQDTYQKHVSKSWARQRLRRLCASRTGSGELERQSGALRYSVA